MIYFIQAQDKIKIGVTDDPVVRITELQTGNPYRLICKLLVDGSFDEERRLHRMFLEDRLVGEWFSLSAPIKEYINERQHENLSHRFFLEKEPFYSGNEQIKSLRRSLGVSGSTLGNMLGVSRAGISQFESRERSGNITFKTMRKIANALGYEFDYRFIPK